MVTCGRTPPSKLHSSSVSRDCDSTVDEVEGAAVGVTRDLKGPLDELLVWMTVGRHHPQSVQCGVEGIKHHIPIGTYQTKRFRDIFSGVTMRKELTVFLNGAGVCSSESADEGLDWSGERDVGLH